MWWHVPPEGDAHGVLCRQDVARPLIQELLGLSLLRAAPRDAQQRRPHFEKAARLLHAAGNAEQDATPESNFNFGLAAALAGDFARAQAAYELALTKQPAPAVKEALTNGLREVRAARQNAQR